MKGKVLPYPAEVKTETFSEKYDGPTARLTKSFETGNPMRKGCGNSNKGDYNFEALAASNQTIAYSSLTAVHENKKTGFQNPVFPVAATSATNDSVELPGLEPGTTEPKSAVLPLHHSSIRCSKAGTKVRQRIDISKKILREWPGQQKKIPRKEVSSGPNHRTPSLRHRDCGVSIPLIKSIIQCSKI